MNRKYNSHFLQTDQKIQDAYLASLLKYQDPACCSIKEICALAGIHPTTYYSHYKNLHTLSEAVAKSFETKLNEVYVSSNIHPIEDSFLAVSLFVDFVNDNVPYFQLYMKYIGPTNLHSQCSRIMNTYILENHLTDKAAKELLFRCEFGMSGFLTTILYWIENGRIETKEELSLYLFHMVDDLKTIRKRRR